MDWIYSSVVFSVKQRNKKCCDLVMSLQSGRLLNRFLAVSRKK